MRRPLLGVLASLTGGAMLACALVAFAPNFARADADAPDEGSPVLVNADLARRLHAPHSGSHAGVAAAPESVWIGYNPNYAGSNYWSVGVGPNRPGTEIGGYWDWDHPVHGDSLMGRWPTHMLYTATGGLTLLDNQRPWWAIDQGNVANYVINQGPGLQRTFGVVGVWHCDFGNAGAGAGRSRPPTCPTWT